MENKITLCVFDNPNSRCRELWQNKLMVRSAPAEMVADFKPGKVEGDPDAVMGEPHCTAHNLWDESRDAAPVIVGVDPAQPAAAPPTNESVIKSLIEVTRTAFSLIDNSEDDGNGQTISANRFDAEPLSDALDNLDALPDNQPNYTMGVAAKAEWFLRDLLANMPTNADIQLLALIKQHTAADRYVLINPAHDISIGDFDYILRQHLMRAGLEVLFNTIMGAAEAGDFLVLAPDKTIHIGGTLDMAYESAKTAAATTTEAPSIITKVH